MIIKRTYITSTGLVLALLMGACSKTPNTQKHLNKYDVRKECSHLDINECSQENKLYSLKKNPKLFLSIKNPNKELQIQAVKENPYIISYIKRPSKEVQIEALKQDPSLIDLIKNPHKDALRY